MASAREDRRRLRLASTLEDASQSALTGATYHTSGSIGILSERRRQWTAYEETAAKLSRKSDTTAAILYALKRWQAFTRYAEDGRLEIDNNSAERALRAVALGRKNFLFAGADSGGERAAAMYTLIGTCRLNGLNPEAYLRHVLSRIADHPINRIAELLPWAVAADIGLAVT